MAVSCIETMGSRKRTGSSNERQYLIKGVSDEVDALTLLLSTAPGEMSGLMIDTSQSEVEEVGVGLDIYIGTAKYQNQVVGSFSYSFNISTTSTILRHSYSTRHKYVSSGSTQRDFKGAINVDKDGNVNGIEIVTPVVQVEYTTTVPNSVVTQAWVNGLGGLVGCVNSAPFKGNDTGEMLFTGVSGQPSDASHFEIRYSFGVVKNTTGFQVDDITGIEKYGWEYLWAYYEDKNDTLTDGTKVIRSKATNVFIEQVYNLASFGGLGI